MRTECVLGTPAYEYFAGRERLVDYRGDDAIRRAREWLDICNTYHEPCDRQQNAPLPRRIVDLGPPNESRVPVLRETDGDREHYVALSYCWGPLSQMKTTEDLLQKFTKSIDQSQLSQTVKDAFSVTRRLGLRYIWIDALCIVQDNPEDFNVEALKMSQYYGNAHLTIAAGSAAGCHDGFLVRPQVGNGEIELRYSRPEDFGTRIVEHGTVFACLGDDAFDRERDPLDVRGWTLQESILSRRTLFFGRKQMLFRCRIATFDEDGTVRPSLGETSKGDRIPASLDVIKYDKDEAMRRRHAFFLWDMYLHRYSLRHLRQKTDKLIAIAGIAQRVQELSQSRYLFGIWEDDIAHGLAWKSTEFSLIKGISGGRAPLVKLGNNVPSWSWAAYGGPIFNSFDSRYWVPENDCVSLLDCQEVCDSLDPIPMAGLRPNSTELRLLGTPKHVSSTCSRGEYLDSGGDPNTVPHRVPWRSAIVLREGKKTDYNVLRSEHSTSALNKARAIVGFGMLDVWPADAMAELWCLRLHKREGLLLSPAGDHRYKRMGVFWVSDKEWFEQGQPKEVILV